MYNKGKSDSPQVFLSICLCTSTTTWENTNIGQPDGLVVRCLFSPHIFGVRADGCLLIGFGIIYKSWCLLAVKEAAAFNEWSEISFLRKFQVENVAYNSNYSSDECNFFSCERTDLYRYWKKEVLFVLFGFHYVFLHFEILKHFRFYSSKMRPLV